MYVEWVYTKLCLVYFQLDTVWKKIYVIIHTKGPVTNEGIGNSMSN